MNKLNEPPIWVDSDSALADLCGRWQQQAAIAVDTEFMRTSTFYPIAGLIQIGDGYNTYLIDPLAINDFAPLAQLMGDPAVVKVMHACSEDMEVFARLLGSCPTPVFDTQIAAAYTGAGLSLGYAALLEAMLGVVLDKGETRSDWLQRPLSVSQKTYAALDVAHLLVIYGKLLTRLKTLERLEWVLNDCAELQDNYLANQSAERFFLRIKNAWRLSVPELSVLKCLSLWREQTAREQDLPRNRVLKEAVLFAVAKAKPKHMAQLAAVEGMPAGIVREHGAHILQLVTDGLADTDKTERLPGPLPKSLGDLLKDLKHIVQQTAEGLGLPASLLVSKKDYDYLMQALQTGTAVSLPPRLRQWRKALVGNALLDCIDAYRRND